MTWPVGTISTANLDDRTDDPSLSRADLKTAVDQVNAMRDMIKITSPQVSDLLRYDHSQGRFVNTSVIAGLGRVARVAVLDFTRSAETVNFIDDNVNRSQSRLDISVTADPQGFITVTNNDYITLGSGIYIISNAEFFTYSNIYVSVPTNYITNAANPTSPSNILKTFAGEATGGGVTGRTCSPNWWLSLSVSSSRVLSFWTETLVNGAAYPFESIVITKIQ